MRLQGDLRDSMVLIAGSLEPEEELILAAYARVTDEALLLEMLAATKEAGHDELVARRSPGSTPPRCGGR
jgi:hypothetical protein